jgi:hypothetical protein
VSYIEFNRRFQMWSYSAGHSRLLLRSPKSNLASTQIDILFKNVAAIHLPCVIDDLRIRSVQGSDLSMPPQLGSINIIGHEIFQVTGRNVDGYVVAGVVVTNEADLEYDAVSPLLETT